jgi:hypothetical protein
MGQKKVALKIYEVCGGRASANAGVNQFSREEKRNFPGRPQK